MTEYMAQKISKTSGRSTFQRISAKNPSVAYNKMMESWSESYNIGIRTKRDHARYMWEYYYVFEPGEDRHLEWPQLSTKMKRYYEREAWEDPVSF